MSVARAGARSKTAKRPRVGSNCSSNCQTKNHETYGECLRAKSLQLSPHINGEYGSRQKQWDKDLDHYEGAVNQGVQPEGTQRWQVDKALKEAENG